MARPRSALTHFILSLPRTLTAKQVLAQVKAKGMKTTAGNIYRVRQGTGRSSRRGAVSRVAAKPRGGAAGSQTAPEALLRAVAAELGLGHALDILRAERSKVSTLLGR